jgi:hypothetical protein
MMNAGAYIADELDLNILSSSPDISIHKYHCGLIKEIKEEFNMVLCLARRADMVSCQHDMWVCDDGVLT